MSKDNQEQSYLDMSDEDIMKVSAPSYENKQEEEDTEEEVDTTASNQESDENDNADTQESSDESTKDEDDSDESNDEEDATSSDDNSEDEDRDADSVSTSKTKSVDTTSSDKKEENSVIDYKEAYEKLFAPFKANGKEIKLQSVDDAIALMQMGANYNKKMAALKPNLRILKTLEKNNLLDEEKLSFLIDLEKKNPEAINKLIKDSGVDPMDLDPEKASEYKPTQHSINDKELELDQVLDEIQDTPTYTRTLDVIGNKWDKASKKVIAEHPNVIKVINDHIQRGVYDVIMVELERERMLGRLQGLTDIEAYKQVGDAIEARGGFAHLVSKPTAPQGQRVVAQKSTKVDDSKLREKKRAASPSKPAVATSVQQDFNPLSIPDDEFGKLVNPNFL